ncbi:MAG: TraB/GumN family protein [Pseudomonadota bacterium]
MFALNRSVIGLTVGLALLGACGASPSEDATAAPETVETEAAERPTAEELRAEYAQSVALAQETTGPGSPPLWSLSDEDTTIYIFGTVHLLRPEVDWRFPAFDEALAASDKVVFEVDMFSAEGEKAYMDEFLPKGMYQDGKTLRGALNDEDEAIIEAGMKAANIPLDAFNAFEPWMVGVNIGAMQIVADGYDPESGVEKVIYREALAAEKTFGFLESISDQANAFDKMSEASQIDMLYGTLMTLDSAGKTVDDMVAEWADGDMEGLAALAANSGNTQASAELYERILVKRNRNWIPVIEGFLEQPGTVFVAAGSAHFAGADSVILMLEDEGYTVERLN